MFDEVVAVHVPLVRRRVPSLKFEIAGVWSPSIADVINHALWCSAVTLAVDVQSTSIRRPHVYNLPYFWIVGGSSPLV